MANSNYTDVKIEGLAANETKTKNVVSPLLQYVRIKVTGTGTMNLGTNGTKIKLYYKKRKK